MSRLRKMFLLPIAAAILAAPSSAKAAEVRSVSCSVAVDYLFNGVLRAPYQKDFVVEPGLTYQDDFSTVTRFRIFEASTHLEQNDTVVAISYFNDVGVFDSIDLSTTLTLRNGGDEETVSGTHTYWTSLGVAGDRTTKYTLTCRRFKR